MSSVHQISSIGPDGVVRCYGHNLPAALRESHTAGNPNRQFYCCSKDRGDTNRCSFFVWADDPKFQKLPQTPRPTPGVSRERANQIASPSFLSPTTSVKRERPPDSQLSDAHLSPSQKRLKAIEAALQPEASAGSKAFYNAEEMKPARDTVSSRPRTPIPCRQSAPMNDDDNDPFRTHTRTHESSNTNGSASSNASAMYRTPGLEDRKSVDEAEDVGVLLTPPSSSQKSMLSSQGSQPSPTRNKGKKRAYDSGASNWQGSQTLSLSNSQQSLRSDPTLQQPFESHVTVDMSADSIADLLQELGDVPAYVRKLERKQIAAEKSNEAKQKRIEELEYEVETLKGIQEELEDKLEALTKARRF